MGLRQLSKPMYSNCAILGPDGTMLCRSGQRRMNWYLEKGLAEKIDETTIKLNFQPAGWGDAGDPYMLANKENICVVCGSDAELTRHHVVPYCYRVHFPDEGKRHTSYDILPVCVACHEAYEIHARLLRRTILDELRIAETGDIETDWDAVKAIKAANAIKRHGDKIPKDRLDLLQQTVMEYLEKTELTSEDIESAAKLEWRIVPEDYSCASKKVVESLTSIDDFAKRWREHFVSSMEPKRLPENWQVDKKLYDEKAEHGA